MPTLLQRRPPFPQRTMTSADLNRSPNGVALNRVPVPTGAPIDDGAVSTVPGVSPRTLAFNPATGAPMPKPGAPNLVTRTPPAPGAFDPGSFGEQNAQASAGIYQPGSFGAANAQANGTGYKPPQQTERANPLVGDSSQVPTGGTQDLAPRQPANQAMGFSSRGSAAPAGQDAEPSTQDKLESAGAGVQGDLAGQPAPQHVGGTGLYKRTFKNPKSAELYGNFVRDLFGGADASGTA